MHGCFSNPDLISGLRNVLQGFLSRYETSSTQTDSMFMWAIIFCGNTTLKRSPAFSLFLKVFLNSSSWGCLFQIRHENNIQKTNRSYKKKFYRFFRLSIAFGILHFLSSSVKSEAYKTTTKFSSVFGFRFSCFFSSAFLPD